MIDKQGRRHVNTYNVSNLPSRVHLKRRSRQLSTTIMLMIVFTLAASGFGLFFLIGESNNSDTVAGATSDPVSSLLNEHPNQADDVKKTDTHTEKNAPSSVTSEKTSITQAKQTVYTIYTGSNQGSGFLLNQQGDILTNAHVVAGYVFPTIKTTGGSEFTGRVIGFSSEMDAAIVRVPDLAGIEPFPVDLDHHYAIGEKIIALGNPNDHSATSTGVISDDHIGFSIGTYDYKNIYEITAGLSNGSSGGPLIADSTGKIMAINSAESIDDATIGYSLPLHEITHLLHNWTTTPMDEQAVLALFNKLEANPKETGTVKNNSQDHGRLEIPSQSEQGTLSEVENRNEYKALVPLDEFESRHTSDNWYHDDEREKWYYHDKQEDTWYYHDESNNVLMEWPDNPKSTEQNKSA